MPHGNFSRVLTQCKLGNLLMLCSWVVQQLCSWVVQASLGEESEVAYHPAEKP